MTDNLSQPDNPSDFGKALEQADQANFQTSKLKFLLQKHQITKIQFLSFENWIRINSVEANIKLFTKDRPIVEHEFIFFDLAGEIAWALKEFIFSWEVLGADIAGVIPEEIKIEDENGINLRTEKGHQIQFQVNENTGS
jgi:hypothetical protein